LALRAKDGHADDLEDMGARHDRLALIPAALPAVASA